MAEEEKKTLSEIMEQFPDAMSIGWASCTLAEAKTEEDEAPVERACVVLSFSKKGFGFGEFTFVQDNEGQLYIDTERSGKKVILECFEAWLKSAITDYEKDPEKHKRYNQVMKSQCGEHCEICYPKDEPKPE